MNPETPLEKARRCWNGTQPDWVEGLAKACMQTSQNQVAKQMGYSGSLVSSVLANKYLGDMQRVEEVYRGVFEARTVNCPALGEIGHDTCHKWRRKSVRLNPANAQNVMMFRACQSCPVNQKPEKGEPS